MKALKIVILTLMTFSFLQGCNSDSSPEDKLKSYIQERFSGGMDKEEVLDHLYGPLFDMVNEMGEEQFTEFIDLGNVKLNFIKIVDKRCEDIKCFITYVIDYNVGEREGKKLKVNFKTQVKKIAELINTQDGWKISKIDNLKTLHRAKEPININN